MNVRDLMRWEGAVQMFELLERRGVFAQAQREALALGVPLIVVGCPKWGWNHGHGDVTLDRVHPPSTCRCPNPVTGDVCRMELLSRPKGCVVFTSHVLEHLTKEDATLALQSIDRVALAQFHVFPHRLSISAILNPDHRSWPRNTPAGVVVDPR